MPSFTFVTRRELPDTAREMQDRIKYLFAIREELDRELELLMGRRDTFEPAKPWHCVRCDYDWRSRLPHRPRQCPKCKAKKFDSPPLYTYAEKVARKQELLARKKLTEPDPFYKENYKTYVGVVGDALRNTKLPEIPSAPMPHSVITRQVSTEADSIQNVALTPPPIPGTMNPVPLSLRERLKQMQDSKPVGPQPIAEQWEKVVKEDPTLGKWPSETTEDELMEAINGEPDAT